MRIPRRAVRFDDETRELFEKAKESIQKRHGGYHAPESYILERCLKIGLIQVIQSGSTEIQIDPLVTTGLKKEPKKNNIHTSYIGDDTKARIDAFKAQLGNPDLVDGVLALLAGTRRGGRMADSVILGILSKWAMVEPRDALLVALDKYRNGNYAAEGKKENYLWAMIQSGVRASDGKPALKSAGQSGGNGAHIPKGYPSDIYDGTRWYWSEQASGWYPKNSYGKPDFSAQKWAYREGMRKP